MMLEYEEWIRLVLSVRVAMSARVQAPRLRIEYRPAGPRDDVL